MCTVDLLSMNYSRITLHVESTLYNRSLVAAAGGESPQAVRRQRRIERPAAVRAACTGAEAGRREEHVHTYVYIL